MTNFTQPATLRSYEDEVLRAAANRASTLGAVAASPPAGEADGNTSSGGALVPNSYDTIFMTYATMQDLRAAKAVTGLAAISSMDQLFKRRDIHPALLGLVTYSDELGAVPLDGSQLLLYVRKDVLAAAAAAVAAAEGSSSGGSTSGGSGLGVPGSWEQLLALAAAVNGVQAAQLNAAVNATGGVSYEQIQAPVSGFCFPPSPRVLGNLALAVLASVVQTAGPQQGMYLNADTLHPATATVAMPYVLSYLRRLAAHAPREVKSSRAPPFSNDFALGRCAMTVGTAAQFRRNSHAAHPAGPSAVIGKVTVALLPGSDVVLSADGRGLKSCTPSLCPYSERVHAVLPLRNEGSGSGGSAHRRLLQASEGASTAATGGVTAPQTMAATATATSVTSSTGVHVNRAPLLVPEGLAAGLDGSADVMAQLHSWTLLSNFGGPSGSWTLLLQPSAEVGPWRNPHMAEGALDRWAAAGFEATDTQSFLAAVRSTLAHPNRVPPLRIRTALQYTRAVQDAVWTLLDTPPPPTAAAWSSVQEQSHQRGVLQSLQDNVTQLYGATTAPVPRSVLLAEYRSSLGLSAGSPTSIIGTPQEGSGGGGGTAVRPAAAGGIAAAVSAAVLATLGLFVFRACRRRRGLGRRVSSNWRVLEAPRASPDTVLLVTDIEGSTSLWEALPEEAMDRALRVHHITVRTVGRKFYAYESATVRDSFILVFACTANAAQFALELQRALLVASWPQELLTVPACAPVYVRKLDWLAKANQVSLAPAPPRFGGASGLHGRTSGPGALVGDPAVAHSGRGRRGSVVLEALAAPLGSAGAGASGGGASSQVTRMATTAIASGAPAHVSTRSTLRAGAVSATALLPPQGLAELHASKHALRILSYSQTGSARPDHTDSSATEAAGKRARCNTEDRALKPPPHPCEQSHGYDEQQGLHGGRKSGAGDRGAGTGPPGAHHHDQGGELPSGQQEGAPPQVDELKQQQEQPHAGAAVHRGSNNSDAATEAVAPSRLLSELPQELLLPALPPTLTLRPSDLALAFNFAPQHCVASTGGVRPPKPAEAAPGPSSVLGFGDVLHTPLPPSALGLPPLVTSRGGGITSSEVSSRKGNNHVHFQALQHESSGGGEPEQQQQQQQAGGPGALNTSQKAPSFGTPFRAAAAAAASLVQGRRSNKWLPFLHSSGVKGIRTQPSTPSGHAAPEETPEGALGPNLAPDKAAPTPGLPQQRSWMLPMATRIERTSASHVEAAVSRCHATTNPPVAAGSNSASGAVATAAAASSSAALAAKFSALAAELGPGEFSVHGVGRLAQHHSLPPQPQQQAPRGGQVLGVRGWSLPRPAASRNRNSAAAYIVPVAHGGPGTTAQQVQPLAPSQQQRAPLPGPRSSNSQLEHGLLVGPAHFRSFTGQVSSSRREPAGGAAALRQQQSASAPWWSWRPSSNKAAKQQSLDGGSATAAVAPAADPAGSTAAVVSSEGDGTTARSTAGTPRALGALKGSGSLRWPISPFGRRPRQHTPPASAGVTSAAGAVHRSGGSVSSGAAAAVGDAETPRRTLRQIASMGHVKRATPTAYVSAPGVGAAPFSLAGEDAKAARNSPAADAVGGGSTTTSPVASRMGSFLQMLPTRIQSLTLKLRSQLHIQPLQQAARPQPSACPHSGQQGRRSSGSMLSRCSSNGSDARTSAGSSRSSRTSAPRVTPVYPAAAFASVAADHQQQQQHQDATDGPAPAAGTHSLAAYSRGSHVAVGSSGAAMRRGPLSGDPPCGVMETLPEEATQQLPAPASIAPLSNTSVGAAGAAASGVMPRDSVLVDGSTHSVTPGRQQGSVSSDDERRPAQVEAAAAARSASSPRDVREISALGIIIGRAPASQQLPSSPDPQGPLLEAIPDPEHRQPLLMDDLNFDVSLAYNAQRSNQLEAAGGSAERVLPTVPSAASAPKPAALGIPVPGSLLELLRRVFPPLPPGISPKQDQVQQQSLGLAPSETQLVFAGLRVRVGLHCGVTDARDIQYNAATARMTFGGEGLRIAKAVCDCASGGQVVMSGEVLLRLQAAPTASGGMLIPQQGQTHVLDLGDHQLLEAVAGGTASRPGQPRRGGEGDNEAVPVSRQLFSVVPATLLGRLSLMPPVRSAIHQYTPGVVHAPVGETVTVVVFRVAQASALLAWNAQAATNAMTLLEIYLRASLGPLVAAAEDSSLPELEARRASAGGGSGATATQQQQRVACYLAAAPPGSPFGTFVAGFSQPAAAARWALTAAGRMAELPWPAELLESQWGRPLEEVTRAEAEAMTGVRGSNTAASGPPTPLQAVLGRVSRHMGGASGGGAGAMVDGGSGAHSGLRQKLPRFPGARSVPASPLFASLRPGSIAAGPSASTAAGSRAGGAGSSCDGGTAAGTPAGSSFRSNRSGPLFGRMLQRSSSSRITPSLVVGGHLSGRGTSTTGTPLPAALGSGGGAGGLSGSGRIGRTRSAFGGAPPLLGEATAAAARAPHSKSDIGNGAQGHTPQKQLRAMTITAAIYEAGETAVELMPLEATMESGMESGHDEFDTADPWPSAHQHSHAAGGSSLHTMLEIEPWTSEALPANEESGRGPKPQPSQRYRALEHPAAPAVGRAALGDSAVAGRAKSSVTQHLGGIMHARLSAPEPATVPTGLVVGGQPSVRSPTHAVPISGDAVVTTASSAASAFSAHSGGTPSGFVRQTSRLAPNATQQYPAPVTAATPSPGTSPFSAASCIARPGSASAAFPAALGGSSSSAAGAAASAFAPLGGGPAALVLAKSIPEDEMSQCLEQWQEKPGQQQLSMVRELAAATLMAASAGDPPQPPLQEVVPASLGPSLAPASVASPEHPEVTPSPPDGDGGGQAMASSTVGQLSDAVSCPVATVRQQQCSPGAETSAGLHSMFSRMSGYSRLGTTGRRLDEAAGSYEAASGLLRGFAMDDGTVREGAGSSAADSMATAGGSAHAVLQQQAQPARQRQRSAWPRTEYDLPRTASLKQLQPAAAAAAQHTRDHAGGGSGRGGGHDSSSKSSMRRLHARMLRTLTTSFSDVALRRKLAASKSEIVPEGAAGSSEAGAVFASGTAAESAGGSSSRASGKRLFSPLVSHVTGLASPVYSSSNAGRVGPEPVSPNMSTGGLAGLDARHFISQAQSQGHGSSGGNSGFRALQMLAGIRRVSQPGGREPSVSGVGGQASGLLVPTLATMPSATADVVAAAAARAEEDAEVVSFRGLRVRLGMAVGPVRVELCPLTGRVVYSGKTTQQMPWHKLARAL
ncbi:hypothetical protein HYH02_009081 [Chlamydomonas schloesseri]|uniref:Guanylate cyclase domain-containing protein n=1 Tax=Chlamydomonas schloesseri TaxID=2026947 RepID=A0A836B0K6_9CHLO|nr:hypothetical protein HYH02_009081 [Chlamydomonas schloesseri]|eukprot:KAG2444141.1 hypothetical protein HYH02_009081 [Chlamydomonas schloesseri]